jgi:hypothetical protein
MGATAYYRSDLMREFTRGGTRSDQQLKGGREARTVPAHGTGIEFADGLLAISHDGTRASMEKMIGILQVCADERCWEEGEAGKD